MGRSQVHQDEDGLTLIEMMVAMLILGVVLMAMASVAITSTRAVQGSESVVLSTQLGNEVIEELLAQPFEVLGLYHTEATNHFESEFFEGNRLVLHANPDTEDERVPEPTEEVAFEGRDFTVETAVVYALGDEEVHTVPSEDEGYSKRVIVMLTWEERGQTRTARTEAIRAPEPSTQPLTVSIEPDVHEIDDVGKLKDPFFIRVTARDPQSAVRVHYLRRLEGGGTETASAPMVGVPGSGGLEWSYEFTCCGAPERFANGGTLFEIRATAEDGVTSSTTMGRALFLQTLALPEDNVTVSPETISVHATDGPCQGLEVEAEVIGAVSSDPFTLRFDGHTDEQAFPGSYRAPTLIDGARYTVSLDPEDLPLTNQDPLVYHLQLRRPSDETSITREVNTPVDYLGFYTEGDAMGGPVPCP